MAEKKKKKYINKATGQIRTSETQPEQDPTKTGKFEEYKGQPQKPGYSINSTSYATREEYEQAKLKGDTSGLRNPENIIKGTEVGGRTPEQQAILAEEINKLGIRQEGGEIPQIEGVEVLTPKPREEQGMLNTFFFGPKSVIDKNGNEQKLIQGTAPIGPSGAAKLGTFVKNNQLISGALAGLFLGGGGINTLIETITGTRGIDEKQQSLNTLGQITSTIVGDSKTGAGDVDQGLQQLKFIRQEILKLEQDIKKGKIASAQLKVSGKIYDINADIYDQLATIDEGVRDLEEFKIQGVYPEMSPQEMQMLLKSLSDEGYINPIDFEKSRRVTE